MEKYKSVYKESLLPQDEVKILKGKYKDYYGVITTFSGKNPLVTITEAPDGEPLTDAPREIKFFVKDLQKA